MFLTKDALDGDAVPLARPGSAYGNRPTSSYGRPGTGSTGMPSTPSGLNDGAEEGGEEVATPASAENMRAKMLQQRQRLLAKQRSGLSGGANSMVMANKSLPTSEAPAPGIGAPPLSSTGSMMSSGSPTAVGLGLNASPWGTTTSSASSSVAVGGASWRGVDTPTNASTGLLSAHSAEKEHCGVVMPDMSEKTPDTKEEEARRRAARAQDLVDRGLGSEFNPTETNELKPTFDIGTVPQSEMKAFLHNPAPKHAGMIQCRIVRDRSGISNRLHPKYTIESDDGIFLMTAQKQMKNKTPNYAILMSKTAGKDAKDSDSFLGKLRSDFLGIEWVAYGPGLNPQKLDSKLPHAQAMQLVRQEFVAVQYTSSKWGNAKGPRKMNVVMPLVQPNGERLVCQTLAPATEGLIALHNGNSSQLVDSYQNKSPKWNDKIGAYVLNFNKRVTEASVKNFQLCNTSDPDTVYLQFGRVGKDVFNIDFRHPLSPFQAFAVCLSSFDYKLGCE